MELILGLVLFVLAAAALGAVERHTLRVLRRRSLARYQKREAAALRRYPPA